MRVHPCRALVGGLPALLLMPIVGLAVTRHVPSDYPAIQAAIDAAADGDTVLLAPGTYTGPGNRDLLVDHKSLVISSATGDPDSSVIDCENDGSGLQRGLSFLGAGYRLDIIGISIVRANTDAISTDNGQDMGGELHLSNCILADVENAGVNAPSGPVYMEGGEIRNAGVGIALLYGNSCEIQDVRFTANGTGASLSPDGALAFSGCWFTGNHVGVADWGRSQRQVNAVFTDCHFIGNGDGVRLQLRGTFTRCEFVGNTGTGAYISFNLDADANFHDCDIRDNGGDGIFMEPGSALTILSSRITGNTGHGVRATTSYYGLTVANTVVARNGDYGLDLTTEYSGDIIVDGLTVADNGAGISASSVGALTLENTLVAFNLGEALCAQGATYTNCDVYGNGPDECPDGWAPDRVNNDIEANPLICGRTLGDYTIAENSPCAPSELHPQIGALGIGCGPMDVDAVEVRRPFSLMPNVPNPFNPSTTIQYSLDAVCPVTLEIFDLQGRRIRALAKEVMEGPGVRTVVWDGEDDAGRVVAGGVYMSRLRAGDRTATRCLTLIK